ncbi:hypothetical protein [Pedobacter duraquae]|uniref:Uncharacterized protein n=1 Tax=Pedobacter duraquae TaxID=425511 RepID=A0A4R6IGB6_9SPHI|nr:hypothetical protein [Pedobacter duraquae]TDO20866.1 hypothetical protein CLV32_3501 [Pedobacter duraquae]
MEKLTPHFQRDLDIVQRIPIVEEMLEMICRTTGMGFAAVAQITSERLITCAMHDKLNFGLIPGGELKVESTIRLKTPNINYRKKNSFQNCANNSLQY